MPLFLHQTEFDIPPEELFAWHSRPGAFERLIPPWEIVRVMGWEGGVTAGRAEIRTRQGPLPMRFIIRMEKCDDPLGFTDHQEWGPFEAWTHTHRFLPAGSGSILEDQIEYRLPGGRMGAIAAGDLVHRKLEAMVRFRERRIAHDFTRIRQYASVGPLKIGVSGSSGLVGSQLVAFLKAAGHEVRRLLRAGDIAYPDVYWNPEKELVTAEGLEGLDAVVHLAGENVAAGRWTAARKDRIWRSRVSGTEFLCRILAGLQTPPKVLVSGSAIGFYGPRGEELVTETASRGAGFLAEVAHDWEEAAEAARQRGIRVVHPRIGMVVSGRGGALARLLLPFRLGLGGSIGGGRQYVSWIHIDDLLGAILHLIVRDDLAGPVNVVSPHPVPNVDFVRTLGKVLRRPAFLPLPSPAVRLLFGEMGEALLLDGARAVPERLQGSGFSFFYPDLEGAIRAEVWEGA